MSARSRVRCLVVLPILGLLALGSVLAQSNAKLQARTSAGRYLLGSSQDFRTSLFEPAFVYRQQQRGIICYVPGGFIAHGVIAEYPANQWRTVADALRQLRFTEDDPKPHVRVIQRNQIIQADGFYTQEFLSHPLVAGDIIVRALQSE